MLRSAPRRATPVAPVSLEGEPARRMLRAGCLAPNGGGRGAYLPCHPQGEAMSIVRWDPFQELSEMSNRLNRLFNRTNVQAPNEGAELTTFDWAPTVDIVETAEDFQVKAELPEVKKEDVKVSIDDGVLRIEGERKQEKEEKGRKFHRIERSYGSFMRSFTLPDNVDETKMRAEYKDGLLNVRLPKTEKAKPRSIEVKVS